MRVTSVHCLLVFTLFVDINMVVLKAAKQLLDTLRCFAKVSYTKKLHCCSNGFFGGAERTVYSCTAAATGSACATLAARRQRHVNAVNTKLHACVELIVARGVAMRTHPGVFVADVEVKNFATLVAFYG